MEYFAIDWTRWAKVCLGHKCGFIPVHDDGKAGLARPKLFLPKKEEIKHKWREDTPALVVVGLDGGFRESYSYTWLLVMAAGCMQLLQNILILPLYVYVVTLPMMKNVFTWA